MPRSLKEILEQADELADRVEKHDPNPDAIKHATALQAVRAASRNRLQAEAQLADAVSLAREEGHSWATIGVMIGTSGEAARQRYGQPAPERRSS